MNLISGIWKMTWKLAKDYAVKFNNSVSVMAGPAYDYNKDGLADQSFNESRCLSKCFVNFFKNSNTNCYQCPCYKGSKAPLLSLQ